MGSYKLYFVAFFIIFLVKAPLAGAHRHFLLPQNKINIDEIIDLPQAGDLLINEVLFNPYASAPDFIELINVSEKDIHLARVFIATRKPDGSFWQVNAIGKQGDYLESGGIILLSENPDTLTWIYPQSCSVNFWQCNTPRMNNDEGCVVVMNADSVIIDELLYQESWHHFLLNDKNGVSLERISTTRPTQDPNNWQSASAHNDYATPACPNSASERMIDRVDEVRYSSSLISPNGDGYQDELSVYFNLPSDTWYLTMRIFNASGHLVDTPWRNEAISAQASMSWDACFANGSILPIGMYVMHLELWNASGKRREFKQACAVVVSNR